MPYKIFKKNIYFTSDDVKKDLLQNRNLYFTKDYKSRNEKKNKIFLKNIDYDLDYTFLHFVAGLSLNKKKFSVLDFGAGVGNTYIKFRKKGFLKKNIHYSIYDQNINLTNSAKKMVVKNFKKISNLKFYFNFEDIKYHDAIHFGSILEYVDDFQKLFIKIFSRIKKKPKFIFISDLFGTKQKSFYLIANYYGHNYFVKFHNLNDVILTLRKLNYKLIYRNPFLPNIKGEFKFFDMSNLPKKYRITHTWNLFFQHEI